MRTLENDGWVPPGTTDRCAALFAFRNRVVHRIDTRRVYEILVGHRQDLERLLELLLAVPE